MLCALPQVLFVHLLKSIIEHGETDFTELSIETEAAMSVTTTEMSQNTELLMSSTMALCMHYTYRCNNITLCQAAYTAGQLHPVSVLYKKRLGVLLPPPPPFRRDAS